MSDPTANPNITYTIHIATTAEKLWETPASRKEKRIRKNS